MAEVGKVLAAVPHRSSERKGRGTCALVHLAWQRDFEARCDLPGRSYARKVSFTEYAICFAKAENRYRAARPKGVQHFAKESRCAYSSDLSGLVR